MNRTAVFSKTGKGLLEIKNKANRLSKDQYRLLNLVDGKANLLDLADRAKVSEIEVRKILGSLSDGGYVKEFTNPTGDSVGSTVPPRTSYADDLDFTAILGPAQPARPGFYQSAALEQRQREEADRRASEAAASRAREEAERRAKVVAENRARAEAAAHRLRDEAERRAREEFERQERSAEQLRNKAENERKAKEEAERKAREAQEALLRMAQQEKLEAERRAKEEAERRAMIQAEARARVEAEKRAREEAERKAREEEERRRREKEEEQRRREEEEKRRREEEEKRRREEEERRREEAERRRRADEERRRREAEERRRLEEEERKRKEEEERRRMEEEERRRQEEERRRREEEERKRKEEEERRRKEEEERRRKEEEERRRQEEERRRREEEERRRKEEEERRRREEEERLRQEEEERKRKEEAARRLQEEQERLQRELEEKQRREQEELSRRMEEERRRLEDDEYRRRAEEEDRRRQEQEQRQREEEERAREAARHQEEERRREDEQRREEDERRRREDAARIQEREAERSRHDTVASTVTVDALGFVGAATAPAVSNGVDTDTDALKRAEAEVEREFQAKEEAIRRALEEQERRFRMEEEARTAMDKAEREARARADREARELALAAERARREAEQKARDEGVRRAQEEKERRAKEQEGRRKQTEENNKKRERERREAEQRAREEDLVRRRKEQEAQDRRKAEIDRLQGEARRRAFGPGKIAAVALVVLAVLGALLIEVAPIAAYAPNIEKLATQAVGEPVRIGGVRASLFPSFHVELEQVTLGNTQDVKVGKVVVYMGLGSAFSEDKDIGKLVLDSVSMPSEALARVPRWLSAEGKPGRRIALERVQLKTARLEANGVALPAFDADILLASDRSVRGVTIETSDGRFTAELTPRERALEIVARGRGFVVPIGPSIELTEFTAKGVASSGELRVSELEFTLYGGRGRGALNASWGPLWAVDGTFDLQRVELEPAMNAFKAVAASDGTLDARGRFALQSGAPDKLFDAPRLDAAFVVRKGSLSGLDLVRALQSPSREGIAGGKTKFDELSGNIATSGGRIQFTGVKLAAGALSASGQGEVSEGKEVTGKAYVELRSSASTVRGNFRVQGSLQGMVLRP